MSWETFPVDEIPPGQMTCRLQGNTRSHQSPFDKSVQTLRMPGQRWMATLTWQRNPETDWRPLSGFVSWLGGQAGRFLLPMIHAPRQATAGGSPVINGAGQTGELISTRGWEASKIVARSGDFLSFPDASGRPMLHMVRGNWASTAGGISALRISPPLRRPPADGAPIEVGMPVGVFMLASDDEGDFAITPGGFGAVTVQCVEALVG